MRANAGPNQALVEVIRLARVGEQLPRRRDAIRRVTAPREQGGEPFEELVYIAEEQIVTRRSTLGCPAAVFLDMASLFGVGGLPAAAG